MWLDKEEIKKLLKPFIVIFLIVFFVINWNEVSWLFNYKFLSGKIAEFFPKKEVKINEIKNPEYSEKENILEIPKIGVLAPLIFVSSEKEVSKSLERGVVHFPGSVLPGGTGQTIILGHSAPPGWPKIKYDWVFSRLNELEMGDEISLHFNHQKYTYSVTQKIFLERGEEIPLLTNSGNMLVLISCWPPGKDLKRIAILAKP